MCDTPKGAEQDIFRSIHSYNVSFGAWKIHRILHYDAQDEEVSRKTEYAYSDGDHYNVGNTFTVSKGSTGEKTITEIKSSEGDKVILELLMGEDVIGAEDDNR